MKKELKQKILPTFVGSNDAGKFKGGGGAKLYRIKAPVEKLKII